MTDKTKKARKKALEKNERDYESKTIQIYRFIEKNPKTTLYAMSTKLSIPYASISKIVNELLEEKILEVEKKTEKGRLKKLLTVSSSKNFSKMIQEEKEYLTEEKKDEILNEIFDSDGENILATLKEINRVDIDDENGTDPSDTPTKKETFSAIDVDVVIDKSYNDINPGVLEHIFSKNLLPNISFMNFKEYFNKTEKPDFYVINNNNWIFCDVRFNFEKELTHILRMKLQNSIQTIVLEHIQQNKETVDEQEVEKVLELLV